MAAQRELAEELASKEANELGEPWLTERSARGVNTVTIFSVELAERPRLQVDGLEILSCLWLTRAEALEHAITGHLRAYLLGKPNSSCCSKRLRTASIPSAPQPTDVPAGRHQPFARGMQPTADRRGKSAGVTGRTQTPARSARPASRCLLGSWPPQVDHWPGCPAAWRAEPDQPLPPSGEQMNIGSIEPVVEALQQLQGQMAHMGQASSSRHQLGFGGASLQPTATPVGEDLRAGKSPARADRAPVFVHRASNTSAPTDRH